MVVFVGGGDGGVLLGVGFVDMCGRKHAITEEFQHILVWTGSS